MTFASEKGVRVGDVIRVPYLDTNLVMEHVHIVMDEYGKSEYMSTVHLYEGREIRNDWNTFESFNIIDI